MEKPLPRSVSIVVKPRSEGEAETNNIHHFYMILPAFLASPSYFILFIIINFQKNKIKEIGYIYICVYAIEYCINSFFPVNKYVGVTLSFGPRSSYPVM